MACCAERITWLVLDAKNALPGKRTSMRGGGIKIIRGGETSSVRLPACIIIIIIIIILAHRPETRGKQKMRHRHSGVPRWHRWAGPGDHRGRNMYVVSVHGDGGGGEVKSGGEKIKNVVAPSRPRATNGAILFYV